MASTDEIPVLSVFLPEYRLRRVGVLRHHPVAQGSEQAVGPLPPEKGPQRIPIKKGESHLPPFLWERRERPRFLFRRVAQERAS